jgi:ABC-type transport system involved in multi-copper enzyme maturation permease subunit
MPVGARIWAVAINTFREAIRNKVLYGILVAVVALNFFGIVLGEMSLHEEARVARDVGLAGVSLFGAITAVVLGVSLLYTEIQKKTIHTILAKPLERHEFVLGKYVGMALTLTVLTVVFMLALAVMLYMRDVAFDGVILRAAVLAYFEIMVVAALAVFFSSFSTPFLSGIFTFAIFFLGRATPEIRFAAAKSKEAVIRGIADVGLRLVPDLHVFSISGGEIDGKSVSVNASFVDWGYVGHASLYALAWIIGLLVLASLVFRRRDFV